MTIETKHSLGDVVRIVAIQTQGRIDAVLVDSAGLQIRVVYWNDGSRHSVWLYEWEVE